MEKELILSQKKYLKIKPVQTSNDFIKKDYPRILYILLTNSKISSRTQQTKITVRI